MLPANARQLALAAVVGLAALTGCGQALRAADYPDGDYRGSSSADDSGAVGTVEFTIGNGTVTAASFVVRDADGTVHDENYGLSKATGKPVDAAFYQRAQAAIAAEKQYVAEFREVGDADEVDVIAGASLSHKQFLEAVADALSRHG